MFSETGSVSANSLKWNKIGKMARGQTFILKYGKAIELFYGEH